MKSTRPVKKVSGLGGAITVPIANGPVISQVPTGIVLTVVYHDLRGGAHASVGRVTRRCSGKWQHFAHWHFSGGIDLAQLPSKVQKAARAIRLIEALVHLK